MPLFVLDDFRGGEADNHPVTISQNQVAVSQNIDYWRNTLGGRRNGSALLMFGLPAEINAMTVFQPVLEGESTLWTLNEDGAWLYYDQSFNETAIAPSPADVFDPFDTMKGATLHGKLFIAASTFDVIPSGTAINRLHVWDGTTLRRTGLRAPSGVPSGSDTGSGGVSGTRYYRMRYVVQDADDAVLRRSEPSEELTFTPSGSGSAIRITKLAEIGEGETHWEVEESPDDANWYRIATVDVGTTTYDDTINLPQLIPITDGVVLSADIGDYSLQGSYRWVVADRDRVIGAGNFTDDTKDCDIEWSVVGTDASGVGNDERIPTDTGNRVALDGKENGAITGLAAYDGRIIAFKRNRVYSLTQTGLRASAYLPQIVSTTYGAMENSVVEGTDPTGRAALYFVDPELGPMRLGASGFEVIAEHLRDKFRNEVNYQAAYKTVDAVYHPGRNQVWWNFSGVRQTARGCCPPDPEPPDWPSFRWVYDVKSGGSSFHTLPRLARATAFWGSKPIVTAEGGALVQCDVDDAPDDYGNPFKAYTVSRAVEIGQMGDRFVVRSAMVEGRAVGMSSTRRLECNTPGDVVLEFTLIRDYGKERNSVTFNLNQTARENYVVKSLDSAKMAEATAIQVQIGDPGPVSQAPWVLFRAALRYDANGSNVH